MSGISGGSHLRHFYFTYFSTTTNQLLPSSSEVPGPKTDISEGILSQRMMLSMPECGNHKWEWPSLGFPQLFPPGSRQSTGPGLFQLPKLLLSHEKQQKPTISLQNWNILWFCGHHIATRSSPLTSIWSTGTEFLLDQLQHFVIFLLREKYF